LRKFSLRLEPAASEVKGKCANHLATEVQDKEKYSTKKEGAEEQYESEEIESLIDGMSNLSLVSKL
jgi:hypothetical protein